LINFEDGEVEYNYDLCIGRLRKKSQEFFFKKKILIKLQFQNFFYFSGLTVLLVLMRAYFPAER